MLTRLLVFTLLLICSLDAFAQPLPKKFSTGRKNPSAEVLRQRHRAALERHGLKLRAMPTATTTPAKYDRRDFGLVPPIRDQGDCGSCWNFSGSGIVTCALIKAGQVPNGPSGCSEQYTLDCGKNGGCDGDDNVTVLEWAKATGLPLDGDYGPYLARAASCKTPAKLYKIKDWGFCDGGQGEGIASVQDIKNAMVQYGPIGCAIAADDAFMNVRPGQVFDGRSRDINHDIILIGWDDTRGAWLLRNSWGASWCEGGYCWIKYGANGVGTEAVWCVADQVGPTPPPGPPAPPAPSGAVKVTLNSDARAGTFLLAPEGSMIAPAGSIVLMPDQLALLQQLFGNLFKLRGIEHTPCCTPRPAELREPAPALSASQADRLIGVIEALEKRLSAVEKRLGSTK